MAFSWEEVKLLADLSRLELSLEDAESLAKDLSSIVDYVSKLDQCSTESVSCAPVLDGCHLREDVSQEGFTFKVAESSDFFPYVSDKGFIVPKVKG